MRIVSLGLLTIMLAGASACNPAESSRNPTHDAGAADNAVGDETPPPAGPPFQSRVDGVAITAADSIPPFRGKPPSALCFDSSPGTRQGESVAARGWQVTGEAEAGGYQLVSFVGTMEQGTSGSCLLGDGNIALFHGGDVKAILYAPKGVERSIGAIETLESGSIRIFDGDFLSQPMADIRFGEDGSVRIDEVAAFEQVCGGRAKVPNIYGMPVNRARTLLGEAGWTPLPSEAASEHRDGRARSLAMRGVSEVEDCSGTGFGYCRFRYRSGAGTLSVVTAGDDEWPGVARYSVDCG
ncbi:MAG: hypothetical protein AB7E60_09795 [Sphingobium sp.]